MRIRADAVLLLDEHHPSGRRIVYVALRIGARQQAGHVVGIGVIGTAFARDEIGRDRCKTGLGVTPHHVFVVAEQTSVFMDHHNARVGAWRRRHGHVAQECRTVRGWELDVGHRDVRVGGGDSDWIRRRLGEAWRSLSRGYLGF